MPLVFAGGLTLFFAHVPKAGGTSLERYLEARFGPLGWIDAEWEARRHSGLALRDDLRVSPQHISAGDAARLLPRPPDWSFALVRDPVERLRSEHRFQLRAPRRRRRLAEAGFSNWLHAALALARREPTIFDNHLRPQAEMVPPEAEVFRLEDGFAPLIARLDAVVGASAPGLSVGHALKSSRAETREEEKAEAEAAPGWRVAGPGDAPRGPDLALIAARYAADYARFGYAPPDPAGARPDASAPLRRAGAALIAPAAVAMWRRARL